MLPSWQNLQKFCKTKNGHSMNTDTKGLASLHKTIKELPEGKTATLAKTAPYGSLVVRRGAKAVQLFWRYSEGVKNFNLPIGVFDDTPGAVNRFTASPDGRYGLKAAEKAAQELALQHQQAKQQGSSLQQQLQAEKDAKEAAEAQAKAQAVAKAEAAKAAAIEKDAQAKYTLKALLLAYCDYLQNLGRTSHKDARSIFNLHVIDAWPQLAAAPAKSITEEQVADMMRRLHEAGKGRTANKLRSYARAAYQTAKAAKSKPSIPVQFKAYGITHNPAAETSPDESANKADKNPLTLQELRSYWNQIKDAPGHRAAVLRLHLLTGGQRPEQLFRLKTEDIDLASTPPTITIFDGKGRSTGKPARVHTLPLIPAAAQALQDLAPAGDFALSTDGGKTHITAGSTLGEWAKKAAMEAGIEDFTPKRVRSTVETVLASRKVSQEHRGRLQSHGVSGVQATHYDAHDYLEEKAEAMQTLYHILTTDGSAKILPLYKSA